MVINGHLSIATEEGSIELSAGECCVIPKGVRHKPIAKEETHILLFEPHTTLNTGDQLSSTFMKRELKVIK